MNKIRKLLFSSGLLLLPSLAYAVPVTEFVDTLFIGGGVMLFIAGVLLLLVLRRLTDPQISQLRLYEQNQKTPVQ